VKRKNIPKLRVTVNKAEGLNASIMMLEDACARIKDAKKVCLEFIGDSCVVELHGSDRAIGHCAISFSGHAKNFRKAIAELLEDDLLASLNDLHAL
jgi:hypothetical protein